MAMKNWIVQSQCGQGNVERWLFTLLGQVTNEFEKIPDIVTTVPPFFHRGGDDDYLTQELLFTCVLDVGLDYVTRTISLLLTEGTTQVLGVLADEPVAWLATAIGNHGQDYYAQRITQPHRGKEVPGMLSRHMEVKTSFFQNYI
uniref:Uncharacterized protein n=1 Tax=viral metagenome TaxID=1070528 RepID=A0A2V0RAK6_9ZZZZ